MAEAVFGLLGVLVGGLLNGGVAWIGERRRLKAEAKVAARLVASEVEVNVIAVESALKRSKLVQLDLGSRAQWGKNRAILAAVISDEEWSGLDNFYMLLELLMDKVGQDRQSQVDDDDKDSLKSLLVKGKWSLKALRRYAGEAVTIRVHADSLE
jgi:hypothetical protein